MKSANPFGPLRHTSGGEELSPEPKPLDTGPAITIGRPAPQCGLWLPTNTPLTIDGESIIVEPPADNPRATHALWPCPPGRHVVNNRQWTVRHHDVTNVAIW